MKTVIKNIYLKNIDLIHFIDIAIYNFHIQNYDTALRETTIVIDELTIHLELFLKYLDYFNEEEYVIDEKYVTDVLKALLDAVDNKDYVYLADLFEIQVLPFIIKLQEIIIMREDYIFDRERYCKNISALRERNAKLVESLEALPDPCELYKKGYLAEYTSCGLITLAIEENGRKFYMHGNNKLQNEAFALAKSWYSDDKTEYIVYGLGLGYHVEALSGIDSNIKITVFESDLNIIQSACAFTDLIKIIENHNIQIIYDPDFIILSEKLKNMREDTEFIIHYPSLRNIKNVAVKDKFENYFIQYSSIKNQRILLDGNFRSNIKNFSSFVDELKDKFQDRDLYIVAAGPSLDKNFRQLKDISNRGVILATGTVFHKLMNAGIIPDYVIVSDANPRVYGQIGGLEESNVPMIFLSTAYKGFALNYRGNKYIVCQKDYYKAEQFAAENGAMLFSTGGSVSTVALDIGIEFGCKRIIFLGLDLAFTGDFVHASDTSRRNLIITNDLQQVMDINGNMIYTSRSLNMYRNWIENRIQGVKNIEFIDATEGGAKKAGMKIMKLSDCITKF